MMEEPVCLLVDPSEPASVTDLPIDEAVMYSAVKFCIHDPEMAPNKRWTFEKFYGRDVENKKYILDLLEKTTLDECLSACHNQYDPCLIVAEMLFAMFLTHRFSSFLSILCAVYELQYGVPVRTARLCSGQCYAALYSEKSHLCRLSSITLQNVHVPRHYFKFVDDTDLYEINGVKRKWCMHSEVIRSDTTLGSVDRSRCTFMRLNQAGVTDVFDAKIGVVADATTCERLCSLWSSGFCRSFTFDKEKKMCYLSHITSRLLGRDLLAIGNKNISMGDLDDCVHYQLKCRADDLVVKGSAIKMFKGRVQMKKGSSVICQNEIGGSFDFETAIPYGECGVEKKMDPDMMFSGTIMVKEGSTDLITIKDKVIQVNCRMHQDVELINHRSLSFHLEVNNENATVGPSGHDDPSNPYIINKFNVPLPPKGPKYRLEVFRATGQLADFVNAGDSGYLLVTVNKDDRNVNDFSVSNLVAKDKSTGEQFQLLDEDGCAINGSVTAFERLNQQQLKISMRFEGFRDQAEVVYQAIIKPCARKCRLACTEDLYIRNNYTTTEGRRRRSIVSISNSRFFDLSEDLYAVKSRERVTIVSKSNDDEITKQEVSTRSLSECLTDDVSCLFAVMIALSQVFLFVSCASIMYFYIQQWRHTAALRRQVESASSDVQYEYRVKHDNSSSAGLRQTESPSSSN
uniref:Apple domain-containing protein n=1 Tax=Steinernema glaseri TaxID=37863 RepID=A0A1I7YB77_9BILA